MTEPYVGVESIFERVLEIDAPEQRAVFLNEACGGDQELRRRVEALLRANNDAGSFLERPPAGLTATIAAGDFDTVDEGLGDVPLSFLMPSPKENCLGTLGQYEAIEVVGRGGMGIVLRAYDTKLNRIVAIKVMTPELAANAMAVKRFLREARAAAAVSHDHVVTIFAIEETHRPPFIAMEYIDGQSLQQKIDRRGSLDVKEILRIGMQTARGLAAAHQQGLVHRDIKPANILLENGVERVKLTDFGLARAVDDVSVTQTGQIAGTPQFMSPEQAQGHPIDARSDLFSLGSVLYTMCTGRPAFRADNAVAVLRRVADDTPRSIREVNSDAPDWLEAIIFKLLAKDPADRFQSAEEVAELLGRHLAHVQHPSTASMPERVAPPIRGTGLQPAKPAPRAAVHKSVPHSNVPLYVTLALLIVTGLFALAVVVYVVTDKGTLIVETNDPGVKVVIEDDGKTVLIVNTAIKKDGQVRMPIVLRSGTYVIRPFDDESVVIGKNAIVLKRGDEVIVRVRRVEDQQLRPATERDTFAEIGRFRGHGKYVYNAIVSPDSKYGISGGGDNTIRVWDIETQKETRVLKGHQGAVFGLAVSPDGKLLASSDSAKSIRLWNLETGEQLAELTGHEADVTDLAFMPDGTHLLSAGFDKTLRLWNIFERKLVRTIELGVRVEKMEPLWDGRRVMLSGAHTGGWGVLIYDLDQGNQLNPKPSALSSLAVSVDRRKTLIGSITGLLQVVDRESRELIVQMADPRAKAARDAAISPDGRFAVTTTRQNKMYLWNLAEGNRLASAEAITIGTISLSPDGRIALTIGSEDGVGVWRMPQSAWPKAGKDDNLMQPADPPKSLGHAQELDQLVELAENDLARVRTLVNSGVVPTMVLMRAEAGLIEIKVRRAEARKEAEIVAILLGELVKVRETELQAIQALNQAGKVTASEVSGALKTLLEAKVRYSEARSDQ